MEFLLLVNSAQVFGNLLPLLQVIVSQKGDHFHNGGAPAVEAAIWRWARLSLLAPLHF